MNTNCDTLLQRLNNYLDGQLPVSELDMIRQEAGAQAHCQAMVDAMLRAHEHLFEAPMITAPANFAQSVSRAIVQRQRRDKLFLGGVLFIIGLTVLAPFFFLLWTGLIITFEPGIVHTALNWMISGINTLAAYFVAGFLLMKHLPQWSIVAISTIISVALLTLALTVAMTRTPEMIAAPARRRQIV